MFNSSKKPLRKHIDFQIHTIEVEQLERSGSNMTKHTNNHTLNYYVKSPEARLFIRAIAFLGYIALGVIWWVLYLTMGFLYQLLQELIETLGVLLEGISEFRRRLEELHKEMPYGEMMLRAIGTMTALTLAIIAFYIFVVAITLIPV
jgi:cation transport ATPase